MKKKLILILILFCTSCFHKSSKTELTLSVASSVCSCMKEIASKYEQENPMVKIKINCAGSGVLENQIKAGLEADIFLSASPKNMDNLERENYLEKNTRSNLLKNRLVLAVHESLKNKIKSVKDIPIYKCKVGVGSLSTVPAGQYAEQVLKHTHEWELLQPYIVYQNNVSTITNLISLGELDVGFVYFSDAYRKSTLFIVEVFSEKLHDPIQYPLAILRTSSNLEQSKHFVYFLNSEYAAAVFKEHGFEQ